MSMPLKFRACSHLTPRVRKPHKTRLSSKSSQSTSTVKAVNASSVPPLISTSFASPRYGFRFQYPFGINPIGSVGFDSPSEAASLVGDIFFYSGTGEPITIEMLQPGIVHGDYGFPEAICGEWNLGPDNAPVSSATTTLAGAKTLYVISRQFLYATSTLATKEYYCVNHAPTPIVIAFNESNEPAAAEIIATFELFPPQPTGTYFTVSPVKWVTYTDPAEGFSFEHPDWKLATGSQQLQFTSDFGSLLWKLVWYHKNRDQPLLDSFSSTQLSPNNIVVTSTALTINGYKVTCPPENSP